MKFGVLYLPTYVPELDGDAAAFYGRMLDQVVVAEEVGFDSVWLTEHHFHPYGGTIPDPAVFGTAIAMRTRRIRIGVAVSVLPMHSPLLLAEQYAMLDVLSGGRLDFGVGRGSIPAEYEQLGIPQEGTAAVMAEATDLIRRAWSEETVEHHGQHYRFPSLTVLPRPVQQPHPPIWVGASKSTETFEWAGRHGFHVMVLPYMVPTDTLRDLLATYRDALRANGHDPATREVFAKFHVFVADSLDEARRLAGPAYDNYQNITGSRSSFKRSGTFWDQHVAEGKVITGTPDDCAAHVRHWRDTLGITHIGGTFHFGGLGQAATLRSLNLFAREVAPRFRDAPAAVGGVPAAQPA